MSIQAPPNLTPEPDDVASSSGAAADPAAGWRALLDAGINDWGGISPITHDFVNPEAPWPHLRRLVAATAAAGKALLPRLPVYPRYLQQQQLQPAARPGQQQQQELQQPRQWLDGTARREPACGHAPYGRC